MILKPEEKKDYVTVYISSEILMREDKLLSSIFLYHIKPHPTLLPGLAGNPISKILWRSLSCGVVQVLGGWGQCLKVPACHSAVLLALTQVMHERV